MDEEGSLGKVHLGGPSIKGDGDLLNLRNNITRSFTKLK